MNIFVLDTDPAIAAKYHCDKHVVKMILESVQMLMTSYYNLPEGHKIYSDKNLYKRTHIKHPCTIWCNESMANWKWLYQLTIELNKEYKTRYGHTEDHLSLKKLDMIRFNYGLPPLPEIGMTEFATAMPDEYKVKGDAVQSYKNYYIGDKQHLATWKNGTPEWFEFKG